MKRSDKIKLVKEHWDAAHEHHSDIYNWYWKLQSDINSSWGGSYGIEHKTEPALFRSLCADGSIDTTVDSYSLFEEPFKITPDMVDKRPEELAGEIIQYLEHADEAAAENELEERYRKEYQQYLKLKEKFEKPLDKE